MRIGIDARILEQEERTGVARYLVNLLREFCALAPEHEYVLYLKNENMSDVPRACIRQKLLDRDGLAENVVFEHYILPKQVVRDGIDLVFSPGYTTPMWCRCKRVVAIHDISYQLFPQWFKFDEILKLRTISRISAKRATKVLAVSEYTKKEILRHYRVPPEKVVVTYAGLDPKFKVSGEAASIEAVCRNHGINEKYILYVGAMFFRRNIPLLLAAFRSIMAEIPHQLVLVGPNRTNPYQDISALIQEKGLEQRVVWIEYAPDEDLPFLYEGADAFVLLSTYEGFGLPVVEAMACGTPVVVSNLTSLPEVVGQAGILVKDLNETEVGEALLRVVTDNGLKIALTEKGLKRANEFSWKKTAEKVLAVFGEVAGE